MTKKAKASLRLPTRTVGLVGYFILYVLWLQAIALVAITILQYGVFNHIGTTGAPEPHGGAIGSAIATYTVPLYEAKPTAEPSWIIDAGLWVLLVAIGVLAIIYIGKMGANLLRHLLRVFKVKISLGSVFAAKFIGIGIAFTLITSSALLIPAVGYILPLNIALTVACYILFAAQLWLTKHQKVTAKDIL